MRKMRYTAAFLAVLLAIFATLFLADEAAAKPNWVTVKYTGASILTTKNTKIGDANHYRLKLKFDVVNNSKNGDIITAVFDRQISYNGTFIITKMEPDYDKPEVYGSGYPWKSARWKVKYGPKKFTNPDKGEWYPGQIYKYEIAVDLKSLIKPKGNWKTTNEALKRGFNFKPDGWNFDFQVQSHR